MEDPRVGLVLADQYLIHERLAAGGTGVVYRATHAHAGEVAVKFLHDSAATSATGRGRFRREAEAMRRLTHPNLTGIIGFGSHHGTLYLVMELCPGVSLRRILEAGPLELPRAVNIIRQILAGLGMAHDAGVVHRDLKPGNILLVESLGDDHVKILDFGVAKLFGGDLSTEGLSVVAGKPLGTPQYMSPEQARGLPVDARTDLYAAGILLYEMTTGSRPFDTGIGFAILRQQVEDAPRPPRALRPEISRELEAVILKAMKKEPGDRFQSAAEMAAALALVPELEPPAPLPEPEPPPAPLPEPSETAEIARTPGRRGRLGVLASLLVVVAAGATWYAGVEGLIELPAWSPWQPRGAQVLAIEVAAPLPDAAPPPDATAWSPRDAEVVLGTAPPHPLLQDNTDLRGALAGEPFQPHFARLSVSDDEAVLSFAATAPPGDDPCAVAGAPGIDVIAPRSALLGEKITASDGAAISARVAGQVAPLEGPWWLEIEQLDAAAGSATGAVELRAGEARLTGTFAAVYCPDPRAYETEPPRVNGALWDPDHAPSPEALPAQAAAGAFGAVELRPAHANLIAASDPDRWVLSFFADAPAEPCAELGRGDRGVAVVLPADALDETYALSAVLDRGAAGQLPWVGLQPDRAAVVEADILSLRIDRVSRDDVRGRIYIAAGDRRRSLFAGAFRAVDCR